MEKKYLKSAYKLFFKLIPFAPVSGISNEILCTLVAQETVKLSHVKVGGLKTNSAALPDLDHSTVVWKDKLDLQIVQGIWLGPWSKVPIEQLEFIEN